MDGQTFEQMLESSQEFYAKIRKDHNVTITASVREIVDDVVIYTISGAIGERKDTSSGVSSLENLKGMDKANAIKAAETQAKNRLTTSLTGIKWLGEGTAKAVEPAAVDQPQVNNEPAEVVPDMRLPAISNPAATIDPEIMKSVETTDLPVLIIDVSPIISENQLSRMHVEAQSLQQQVPATSPVPEATVEQGSIFDEPEVLVIPSPAPAVQAAPIVDAVLEACQEKTATGVVMPVPNEKNPDQPTRLQFQGFTVRCTKLVRDVIPKAGDKAAPGLLLPYLRKTFGVKEMTPENTLISVWEATLSKLENAGSPVATLAILKGNN